MSEPGKFAFFEKKLNKAVELDSDMAQENPACKDEHNLELAVNPELAGLEQIISDNRDILKRLQKNNIKIQYIDLKQAKEIYSLIALYCGLGSIEVVSLHNLEVVLNSIKSDYRFPFFADKLTHLFYCSSRIRFYKEGRKMFAMALATQFLLMNGYEEIAKEFMERAENIVGYIAKGKISIRLLHDILEAIINKINSEDEVMIKTISDQISSDDKDLLFAIINAVA